LGRAEGAEKGPQGYVNAISEAFDLAFHQLDSTQSSAKDTGHRTQDPGHEFLGRHCGCHKTFCWPITKKAAELLATGYWLLVTPYWQ